MTDADLPDAEEGFLQQVKLIPAADHDMLGGIRESNFTFFEHWRCGHSLSPSLVAFRFTLKVGQYQPTRANPTILRGRAQLLG